MGDIVLIHIRCINMKLSVLASGSKGNSTYIETKENRILVDLGTSSLYVEKKLKKIGIDPHTINSIFLTHTHIDHISGLRVFLKKYQPTVFLTRKMYEELVTTINIPNYYLIEEDTVFHDLTIHVFKTSHDVSDSNGYIFESDGKSIVYITDTGYINRKYFDQLKNKNYYVMESNHDIELLMNGKYPYHLKQRILGDRGHLSNKDCAKYLSSFIGEQTEGVILIHLSHENNKEEVALQTLEETLERNNQHIDHIIISKQDENTELVEV